MKAGEPLFIDPQAFLAGAELALTVAAIMILGRLWFAWLDAEKVGSEEDAIALKSIALIHQGILLIFLALLMILCLISPPAEMPQILRAAVLIAGIWAVLRTSKYLSDYVKSQAKQAEEYRRQAADAVTSTGPHPEDIV